MCPPPPLKFSVCATPTLRARGLFCTTDKTVPPNRKVFPTPMLLLQETWYPRKSASHARKTGTLVSQAPSANNPRISLGEAWERGIYTAIYIQDDLHLT